ncbi:hypothetical protein K438DRAFT_1766887 [Mycena galopus ATCC 62051]|nr:hypothetical protein K438DRAFT_1978958 [Mycena galopus ATCC 62051]KAF8181981.1 hypothetical protein K438DRAFT_2168453 [Mycena galopus ATCC 62051]KAF8183607.1 hypothetical protein K438DRAFT_1766887 [Mycena galopus ATCC 62051]
MLKRILNLLLPRKDPEKMGALVESLTPSKSMPGLMVTARTNYTTGHWLKEITGAEVTQTSIKDIHHCVVGEVKHIRTDADKGHEKIVFTYHLIEDGVEGALERNSRAAAVHRRAIGTTEDPFPQQMKRSSADCLGWESSNADSVWIDANTDQLRLSGYETVQSFKFAGDVPWDKRLTALDCAILAAVLSERAKDYSCLKHMCFWFAGTFFLAARRICEDEGHTFSQGPEALKKAGTWRGVKLFNVKTGRLTLSVGSEREAAEKGIRKGLASSGMAEAEIEEFIRRFQNDFNIRNESSDNDPIAEVTRLFRTRKGNIMDGMYAAATKLKEERLQKDTMIQDLQRQLEMKDRELQAMRARLASQGQQVEG